MESDDEGRDADSGVDSQFMSPVNNGLVSFPVTCGSVSVARSNWKMLDEDSLYPFLFLSNLLTNLSLLPITL